MKRKYWIYNQREVEGRLVNLEPQFANLIILLFTPHVPVYFWPRRHNFRDIELKFCIFPQLSYNQ